MNETIQKHRSVVLVALDDSTLRQEVIRTAASFAHASPGRELHLVFVVENLPSPVVIVPPPEGLGLTKGEILRAARTHLDEMAAAAREIFRGRIVEHLAAGVAWKEILQVAVDIEADLLVLGTHGRSGIKRLLLGSVAEAVVRGASCPVLVLRAKDYRGVASPDLAPACASCLKAQRDSNGERTACDEHAGDERLGRIYAGRRQ